MRKNVFGRQLKRDKNQRAALIKGLLSSLVFYERIKTTHAKAKAIKGNADKIITKAKIGGIRAYHLLEPELSHDAVRKLIDEIAPRFMQRQGGYTRITKIGNRGKDNASMVMMEWTELGAKLVPVVKADEADEETSEGKKTEKVTKTKNVIPTAVKQVRKETKALPAIKTRQKRGDK